MERDAALQRISRLCSNPPLRLASSLSSIPPFLFLPPAGPLPAPLPTVYQLAQPGQRPAGPQQRLPWLHASLRRASKTLGWRNFTVLLLEHQTLLLCSLSSAELHQLQRHLPLSPRPACSFRVTGGSPVSNTLNSSNLSDFKKFDWWIWEMSH